MGKKTVVLNNSPQDALHFLTQLNDRLHENFSGDEGEAEVLSIIEDIITMCEIVAEAIERSEKAVIPIRKTGMGS